MTTWILIWCIISCRTDGIWFEGPQEWRTQRTFLEGRPFCAEGGCNSARTCDVARVDIIEKAHKSPRAKELCGPKGCWVHADCAEEPANGKFDYDTE